MKEHENTPHDGSLIERQVGAVCLGAASVTILSLVAQILLIVILSYAAPSAAKEGWYAVAVSSIPMYLIAMPLSYFLFRLAKPFSSAQRKKLPLGVLLGLLAVSFGVAMLGGWLGNAVQAVISALTGKSAVNPVEALTLNTPLWANLLFCGILAPIAEEIIYRKLVIDRLRPLGELPAVLLSGLLFGLIHGNFNQVFYAALFGFLAGFVYVYTGKLRYTIVLHMAVNLVGGVLSTELIRALGGSSAAADLSARLSDHPVAASLYIAYTALMLVSVVATPFVLFFLRKRFRVQNTSETLSLPQIGHLLVRHPAFWLLAVILVLMFLV